MRYALVNNERIEAQPSLKGLCPGCSQSVTAVCGEQRIWHWRHLTKKTCDRWWEPETEWHRAWKSNFLSAWQEFIMRDPQSGERHIADVRTPHGLVIEFQHSYLNAQERQAREQFYRNMVWVVDGTRLQNDYTRFLKGMTGRIPTQIKGVFFITAPKKCFPSSWLASSVPVFFDFRGVAPSNPSDMGRELLWCLRPYRTGENAMVIAITRESFISEAHAHGDLLSVIANVGVSRRPQATSLYGRGNWRPRGRRARF